MANYIPAGATPLQYDELDKRYVQLDRAIRGLAITQMVIWFPLGFLYFIGLTPPRGRLHMGMGILFLLFALAGLFGMIFGTTACLAPYFCIYDYTYPLIALVFVPGAIIACASIGVGANHRQVENLLRMADNGRFLVTYSSRVGSAPPYLPA